MGRDAAPLGQAPPTPTTLSILAVLMGAARDLELGFLHGWKVDRDGGTTVRNLGFPRPLDG